MERSQLMRLLPFLTFVLAASAQQKMLSNKMPKPRMSLIKVCHYFYKIVRH